MTSPVDTWARRIRGEADLPGAFRDGLRELSGGTSFPYVVFAPPDRWHRRRVRPKLVCLLADRVLVMERAHREVQTRSFRVDEIVQVETGTLFLYSWMKLHGVVGGAPATALVEYNTVVAPLFEHIVERIRLARHGSEAAGAAAVRREQEKFDHLVTASYKHTLLGKRSCLPGAEVRRILLQPEIRVKAWGRFSRTLSPVHQTILTDRELVITQDAHRLASGLEGYGGVQRFIPLGKISGLEVARSREPGLLALIVKLPGDLSLHSSFTADQEPALEALVTEFEQLRRGPRRTALP